MASEQDKELIQNLSPMRRYRNLLIALAAIASIYLITWTGLDKGLIDSALSATVDVITVDEEPVPATVPVPVDTESPVNLSEESK